YRNVMLKALSSDWVPYLFVNWGVHVWPHVPSDSHNPSERFGAFAPLRWSAAYVTLTACVKARCNFIVEGANDERTRYTIFISRTKFLANLFTQPSLSV